MNFDVIDMMYEVTTMLSDIVREQAYILEQADIPEELKEDMRAMRDNADAKLDNIEYRLRRSDRAAEVRA
jgi:hypothetical protein